MFSSDLSVSVLLIFLAAAALSDAICKRIPNYLVLAALFPMLDELSEVTEEMTEDSLDKEGEDSVTLLSEEERIAVQSNEEQLQDKIDEESLQKKYKRIDFCV